MALVYLPSTALLHSPDFIQPWTPFQPCCPRASPVSSVGNTREGRGGMVKMRVLGAEEPGLHLPPLPDDSGEELSRVHRRKMVNPAAKANFPTRASTGPLQQIWWKRPISHRRVASPPWACPCLPNSSPLCTQAPEKPPAPERKQGVS